MRLLIFYLFCSSFFTIQSQNSKTPIKIDKAALSGIGLKKITLKDQPDRQFYQRRLYKGEDISVYMVSSESWNTYFKSFRLDEFVYMLNGQATVTTTQGKEQTFYSEDYFLAPKGYTGKWHIQAGDLLHYELSVIATKRTPKTLVSNNLNHIPIAKTKLSGSSITLNKRSFLKEVVAKGVELTVSLVGEKPRVYTMTIPQKEKMIKVLSGQLTLIDSTQKEYIFYAGDFFVLPKGYTGQWKSEGHGFIKYLTVEKTE